jgi:hypothetical protein
MTRNMLIVIYAVLMVAIIVGVDVLVFRHRLLERLITNIAIVMAFAAIYYFRFLRRP